MKVCVHVFYGNRKLVERLENSRFDVTFICVRDIDVTGLNLFGKGKWIRRQDVGVDMGSWNFYLEHVWDEYSNVLFMQDDTMVLDLKALDRLEWLQCDHASVFKSQRQRYLANHHHGRVFYCSGRLLRRLGNFPCDYGLKGLPDGSLNKPLTNEPSIELWKQLEGLSHIYDTMNCVIEPGLDVGTDGKYETHRWEDWEFYWKWFCRWRGVKDWLNRLYSQKA